MIQVHQKRLTLHLMNLSIPIRIEIIPVYHHHLKQKFIAVITCKVDVIGHRTASIFIQWMIQRKVLYIILSSILSFLSSLPDSANLSRDDLSSAKNEISPPRSAGIPLIQAPTNPWIPSQVASVVTIDSSKHLTGKFVFFQTNQFFPNAMHRVGLVPPPALPLVLPTGTESAWERGLRSAKTVCLFAFLSRFESSYVFSASWTIDASQTTR